MSYGTGPVFDRARRLVLFVAGLITLLTLLSVAANAQETRDTSRTWYIFADTAGIAPVTGQPNVYVTWVFAKASPNAPPSSGLIVAWDCKNHKVKRLAQVKYELNADSTGVTGPIQEVDRPWQEASDERLYTTVCTIGPTHDNGGAVLRTPEDDENSDGQPKNDSPWAAPGKPRWQS